MHDVGKIAIPDAILHKPGKLTVEEFEVIKTHTTVGKKILSGSNRQLLRIASGMAHQHHERWDGKGYPRGLKGAQISIFARITTLADIYDALSSERIYKKQWSEERVLEYISAESGTIFDPNLVFLFLKHFDEIKKVHEQYQDV